MRFPADGLSRVLVLICCLAVGSSFGCALIQDLESRGPELHEPPWTDTDFVLENIECAIRRKFGEPKAQMAMWFTLYEAEPDYPLKEYVAGHYIPPRVIIRGVYKSAQVSPLRHCVFVHILTHLLPESQGGPDWNYTHNPRWDELEAELNLLAAQCRLEAQR